MTGIAGGGTYEFASSLGSYITVRSGTYDGPVVAEGLSPVQLTAVDNSDLFPHWNVDDACATDNTNCAETSVQRILNCTPPEVTFMFTEDCDLSEFYINLDITSTGDASTVNVTYDVFGAVETLTGITTGVTTLGPFILGDQVDVTVEHESDPDCNIPLGVLEPVTNCPIPIGCGGPPITNNYCYDNFDSRTWTYQSVGTGSLILNFIQGTIESCCDDLAIYDGLDATGTLLYQFVNGQPGDVSNISVISLTGSLHMVMSSDVSVSCTSGSTTEWIWEVNCLNCVYPQVTTTVVEDCDNNQWSLEVDVVSTGDGSTVNLNYAVNGGGIQSEIGVGAGVTVLGPFVINDEVDLEVAHESDVFCNLTLPTITDPGNCPNLVTCGAPAFTDEYCYTNNTTESWLYTAIGTGTLRLTFTAGSIQSSFNDRLIIYDGVDATGPILYEHLGPNFQNQLAGIQVNTTSGSLFMETTSDAFTSCSDGNQTTWEWNVQCLDCLLPAATATIVEDCANNQFTIPLDVTSVGDGASATVSYTVNGGAVETITGVGVGETILGPFTVNDVVNLTLEHESNPLCNIPFGDITDPGTCPTIIVCGATAITESYCYLPNDAQEWRYQSGGAGTLRLRFNSGTIESNTFDDLAIYDGLDATGPQVFVHNNTSTWNLGPEGSAVNNTLTQFYEVEIYSTTGNLYMQMSSDGSVQCGGEFPTTTFDSWEWEVVCLDCSIPTGTVTIVDDCANDQFSLSVDVTGTGDAATANIEYILNGGALQVEAGVGVGITVLGPFAFGDVVNVVLAHESNVLCNIDEGDFSETGTCPLLIACDGTFVQDSVCFGNNEDLRYYYQGTGTFPLGLFFDNGLVSFGDVVTVHDGGDITAPVIFQSTPNQDLTGVFVSTTNPENRMTIRILADGFTSCADGGLADDIAWQVGCLDCVPPVAEFSIVQDCEDFQYFVDVVVTSLGTDPEVEIANTAGVASTFITAPGTYQVGPFVSGTELEVTLVNDANNLCNLYSGTLVNPLCPTILCGSSPVAETYCYLNNENRAWAYEVPAGATIQLVFQRGTIESNTWDDLTIFDGPDANGPVLFVHDNTLTYNLGPEGSAVNSTFNPYYAVDVTTTTGNLYMTLTTDGSVSCESQAGSWDSWEWTVQCLGCQAPGVAYNLVADCIARTYVAEVIVTQTPGVDGLEIVNEITAEDSVVTAPGVYVFGPYAQNDTTVFGITDLANTTCTFISDSLTYSSDDCIISTCEVLTTDLCYANNEDRWYTYQSIENVPMTVAFEQGQMLTGDRIVVYNGFDETATVIYQGANGGNLAGFAVNSQNPNNVITLRIQSNDAGSCADGSATVPLRWAVGCGAVGVDEASSESFSVYPNPTRDLLTIALGGNVSGDVLVRVLDMSGRVVLESPYVVKGGGSNTISLAGLQTGQYMIQLNTDNWVKTQRVQVAR